MNIKILSSLLLAGLLSMGQSFAADNGAIVGGAVGGALGAAIGHDANGRNGAIVGGAIGGATGAAIGSSSHQHSQTTVVKERVVVRPYPVVRQKVVYINKHHGYRHGKHKGWHKKDRHHRHHR